MKLGVAIMDRAFEWRALLGIGSLIKHIILFFIGLYILWGFFKLFFRFCCYFVDIIIAMTFFAFFFPLSLMLMSFRGASDVPAWLSALGKNVGTDQIKKLINAIITLASATVTYVVIMVIIAKFFTEPGQSVTELMDVILSGQIFADDLNYENIAALTLMQTVVLIYVLNFVYSQIPKVTQMILGAFNVQEEKALSEEMANNAMGLTELAVDNVKKGVKTVVENIKK